MTAGKPDFLDLSSLVPLAPREISAIGSIVAYRRLATFARGSRGMFNVGGGNNVLGLPFVRLRIHFVEILWHELDPKLVESKCVSEMASMCRGRRGRKENISSYKSHGGDSIPDRDQFWATIDRGVRILKSPYSDEVHSQAFPGKRILELPRDLPRLRLS